ncbi:MAG: transporter substrate-binding domain-containing protein, partial [Fibrobacteres bacterium]|nr:transporter substrate-binding domain-containing protein [Fibrobacterota bacterium]
MVSITLRAIIVFLLFAPLLFADSLRVVRVASFNYPNAIFQDPSTGKIKGFFVDALDSIAHAENWKIEFVHGTWAEGLTRLKNGEVDVVTSAAKTAERELFMNFTENPLMTVWSEVYVPHSSSAHGILSMKGFRIALMKSDFNAALFKDVADKFSLQCTYLELPDHEAVFSALNGGEADAGIVNSNFGAARAFRYNVKVTDVVLNPFDIHFAVAKGRNRDILNTLDKHLDTWHQSKKSPLQEARQRWTRTESDQVFIIPAWVSRALLILVTILLIAFLFILMLRMRVRKVTRELLNSTASLRESELRHRTILTTITDIIFVFDANGCFLDVHAPANAKLLMSPDAIKGKRYDEVLPPYLSNEIGKALLLTSQGAEAEFDYELTFEQSIHTFSAKLFPRMSDGHFSGTTAVVRDITERKKAEATLQRTQKLESIGILAGGIAHDFNNLLGGIFGYIESARAKLENQKTESARETLGKILTVYDRARHLTSQLLTFSKGGAPSKQVADLLPLIRDTVNFALSGSNVKPSFDFPSIPVNTLID